MAVWLMLPVYMANDCATLFGGGRPIDGGRTLSDGRRILGDHKTVNGFIIGVLGGIATGVLLTAAAPYVLPGLEGYFHIKSFTPVSLIVIAAMSIGALTGDAVKSFFKRRLGFPSGSMLPVADQLDFIVGSLVFGFVADPSGFMAAFTIPILALIVVMTFPIQLFHNAIAVMLGKKKVLW